MIEYRGLPLAQIPRIGASLFRQPRYISRYLTQSLLNRKSRRTPLDLELPWFPYAVIEFLISYLTPTMTVGEFGCGGSTVFFARRVGSIHTIEDNPQWFQHVRGKLNELQIENVTIELHPFDTNSLEAFCRSDYLHGLWRNYDVIVVDGTDPGVGIREACFRHAEHHVNPGGIIVVDDAWRYPDLDERHGARMMRDFQSVKPCNLSVSTTNVYFY